MPTHRSYAQPPSRRFLTWSVRARLQLLVTLPLAGLAILAAVQASATAVVAADGQRGRTIAGLATATSALVHLLQRELAETQAFQGRGGASGEELVTAARARTDVAGARYRAARDSARAAVPGLGPVLAETDKAWNLLAMTRTEALSRPGAFTSTSDTGYRAIVDALLDVADALPGQVAQQGLAGQGRAIAALAGVKHSLAGQRDLLRQALARKRFLPGEEVALARLIGREAERLDAFHATADPAGLALLRDRLTGPDVLAANEMRAAALSNVDGVLTGDADAWYVAATHTLRRMHDVELALAAGLERSAAGVAAAAWRRLIGTVALAALVLVVSATTTVLLAVRTSQRLRRLRRTALNLANRQLPEAIAAVATAADPIATRDRWVADAMRADARLVTGQDEIGEVGRAFGSVHQQALALAAGQALLRRDISAVFAALARRSQALVGRQLKLIDKLEATETDPDTLDWLYKLDHLAARMRRNDENLLVLSGDEPARRFATAVVLHDVVRAAAAEIEDYARVEPFQLPEVAIAGHAVGDLVHLLAELLENATRFSAPDTAITVTASLQADQLTVAIHDRGLGMHDNALAAVNRRLGQPGELDAATVGTMGLLVVARLAARHGIGVRLHGRGRDGVTAIVRVPATLTTEAPGPPLTSPPGLSRRPPPVPIGPPLPLDGLPAETTARLATVSGPTTAAGLPRRGPGGRPAPGSVVAATPTPTVPLDPHLVRARLGSLARGVAAARREIGRPKGEETHEP